MLSGLDIYKLLPKTNCRECGFVTCLAFAMQIAKKAVRIDKCPYLTNYTKETLEASNQPAIKLVTIGQREDKLVIGNETVLFRHEEKFHHPCGLGFIISDDEAEGKVKEKIEKINRLSFERIGQQLKPNLAAIKQKGSKENFLKVLRVVLDNTKLALVLMPADSDTLKAGLEISKERVPLIYNVTKANIDAVSGIIKESNCPLVVSGLDLDELSELTMNLSKQGFSEMILDTGKKNIADKIWDLTQIRRQALKKSNRSLGYPALVIIEQDDPFEEVIEAATYIAKYAGIILLSGIEPWQALSLLTLRQNIYTDPQKPLQIEPKLYAVGKANEKSPVLVTTNFSLSYYTVLGEVEASKIPAYILSVDTEGMSVLTAWAAEKFTPDKITEAVDKFGVGNTVSHKKLIIPGYVAVLSGELEEKSSWQIIVGPKEAAGIPSFLKNL